MATDVGRVLDYVVLALELAISLGIGIYFSFQQKTMTSYAQGKGHMSLLPVSFSLAVTVTSTIAILGVPAEIYLHGMEIAFELFQVVGLLLVIVTFLPIFFEYKFLSMFEYIKERYENEFIKQLCCILYAALLIMYSAVCFYGPAMGVETLLEIPVIYTVTAVGIVCVIYTTIGGLNGVVWVDAFQSIIMILGLLLIVAFGLVKIGINDIWKELTEQNRTKLNLNPDPFQRSSMWIWVCFVAMSFRSACGQTTMLRYTGVRTYEKAKLSIIIGVILVLFFESLCILVGMIVFAYFSKIKCGPLEAGKIRSANQIVPYFVINVINYPGISGLFIATVVAAGLSTASSTINATAILIYKDLVSVWFARYNLASKNETRILKLLTLFVGLFALCFSWALIHAAGSLMHVASLFPSIISAPMFSMFILGASFTFISSLSASIGCIGGVLVCLWVSLGNMFYGNLWEAPKVILNNCSIADNAGKNITAMLNETYVTDLTESKSYIFLKIYSLSPYAYGVLGLIVPMIIALLLSLIPRFKQKTPVKRNLLFPFVRYFVKHTYVTDVKEPNGTSEPFVLKRFRDLKEYSFREDS